MIIDVTGIELTPGNNGEDCKGNGKHLGENGNPIECCCDECDYFLLCFPEFDEKGKDEGIALSKDNHTKQPEK